MSALDKEVMEAKMEQLSRALERFSEALLLPEDAALSYLDTSAHRFMLCYDLVWKMLSRVLSFKGIEAKSPVSAFREAYQQDWLQDKELFASMIKDRNIVTHEYFQAKAEEVYRRLPGYLKAMREVAEAVEKGYRKDDEGL